mmetsp:Transcript_109735/g.186620  ORF Transcript_109735/g.186620 Transcript_109735/m.186620 type:complete len:344 (+) Transcript_109735:32-1063(+)
MSVTESTESTASPPAGRTLACVLMAMNVFMTVGIVIANKTLFTMYNFYFAPTLLLTLHQATCSLGAHISDSSRNKSEANKAPAVFIAAIVLTRTASNALANLSLKFNTVGTYQLLKMLNIPFVFVGEWIFLNQPLKVSIAITLTVLCVGVGIATIGDISFSIAGTIFGCTSPVAAAANALLVKHVQSAYKLKGNELLKSITPWIVLTQIGLIFVTDDITQLPHWLETETTGILVLALSCLLAWGLEWSYVSVVDCTSAMTMQVLGHVKTVWIIVTGYLLFASPLSTRTAYGMSLAMAAVGLYTYLKNASAATKVAEDNAGESAALTKNDTLCEFAEDPKKIVA